MRRCGAACMWRGGARAAARRCGLARETVRTMLRSRLPPGYRRQQPIRCPKLEAVALLHESELARTDPDPQFLHRPMRYDIGLPSPVI